MKILNFNEYINEGLWSKGVKRAKQGITRVENLTPLHKHIETIEWIDMGHPDYLFEKMDLYKGQTLQDFIGLTLPEGIEMMDEEMFKWLRKNSTLTKRAIRPFENAPKCAEFTSNENNNKTYLTLNYEVEHMVYFKYDKPAKGADMKVIFTGGMTIEDFFVKDTDGGLYTVKLIKRKK